MKNIQNFGDGSNISTCISNGRSKHFCNRVNRILCKTISCLQIVMGSLCDEMYSFGLMKRKQLRRLRKMSYPSGNLTPLPSQEKEDFAINLIFVVFFFFGFVVVLQGCTCKICKFSGQGENWSCSCRPTPQPQQNGI